MEFNISTVPAATDDAIIVLTSPRGDVRTIPVLAWTIITRLQDNLPEAPGETSVRVEAFPATVFWRRTPMGEQPNDFIVRRGGRYSYAGIEMPYLTAVKRMREYMERNMPWRLALDAAAAKSEEGR